MSTVSTRHVYPVDLRTGRLHGNDYSLRSYRVSTKNGSKSVQLQDVNCVNLNRFQLKQLIPIEHDLRWRFQCPKMELFEKALQSG